jgi:hypothetical protein
MSLVPENALVLSNARFVADPDITPILSFGRALLKATVQRS